MHGLPFFCYSCLVERVIVPAFDADIPSLVLRLRVEPYVLWRQYPDQLQMAPFRQRTVRLETLVFQVFHIARLKMRDSVVLE